MRARNVEAAETDRYLLPARGTPQGGARGSRGLARTGHGPPQAVQGPSREGVLPQRHVGDREEK